MLRIKDLRRARRANLLSRWFDVERLREHEDTVLLLLTLVIGAVVGLVIVAFILVTENLGARMEPAGGSPWRRLLVPVAGALVTGFLLHRYFPDARGSGIPQTKAALYIRDGYISLRTVLGKFGLSSVSLASGIALGREGPSVQIGAGIASVLGRRLGLSRSRVRALVPVGASAALAAAFNTPISAVLFSLEEVMGDLHARVLGSIVLSAATSWMVLHLLLGDEPLFHVPAYQLVHPVEFLFYAALGVAGGLVSVTFVKLLLWLRVRFRRLPESTLWMQPAAGGLLVGALAWFVPEVLGVGYGQVSRALNGQLALGAMALLVVLKVAATAACYSSGNAGGIFGPSLFIGAMLGGAFGTGAHLLFPDYTGSVGAYALVGMGTAFAGIIRSPLTSVIMIFEITRDYSIIVPLMISNMVSFIISSRLQPEPIYEALQHQEGVQLPSVARDRERLLTVSRALHPATRTLSGDATIDDTLASWNRERKAWPVTDPEGLVGMVTLSQLEDAARQGRGAQTLAGVARRDFPVVYVDHLLDAVLQRMSKAGLEDLPVVSRANRRELKGLISLPDILAAYGLAKDRPPGERAVPEARTPAGGLAAVVGAVAVILLVAAGASYFYRAQRIEGAREAFQLGRRLALDGRHPEAIERYRHALAISHTSEHRLALALALVQAGRLNEADVYLRELLRSDPGSGPANLGLARVQAGLGSARDAAISYRRALYGAWPDGPQPQRVEARIELVEVLRQSGARRQAQAELLSMAGELPEEAGARKRVGRLLLELALPRESAAVFREVLRSDAADGEALAGLGEAEMAADNYLPARAAFGRALDLNPEDEALHKRLALSEAVLALDPSLRRLRAAERYARSMRLLEAALRSLEWCAAASPEAGLPGPASRLADDARKALARRGRPPVYGDATDSNAALAEQLWETRGKLCGAPAAGDEALRRVLARLAR